MKPDHVSLHVLSLAFLFGVLGAAPTQAQGLSRLTGTVLDSATEAPIPRAVVRLAEANRERATDDEGAFAFDGLVAGTYTMIVAAEGFADLTTPITIVEGESTSLTLRMMDEGLRTEEVIVRADRIADGVTVSSVSLRPEDLRASAGLTDDPVRTLTTLPGVAGGADLFSPSEITIRGGAPEEILFLLDGVELRWPWYFGGMKSVYNTDVLSRVELFTGGFPASYGGRLSSVINVSTRSGDFERWHGDFSIGFFNAGLTFEGPIVSEKLSVLVSARRTYLDLVLDESAEFPVPAFGDVTWKATYKPREGRRFTITGLDSDEGIDFIAADPEPGLPDRLETSGGLHAQSVGWLELIGDRLSSRLYVTHLRSRSDFTIGRTIDAAIDGESWGLREDVDWFIDEESRIGFGVEGQVTEFSMRGNFPLDPAETDPTDTTSPLREYDIASLNRQGGAYALYDGVGPLGLRVNAGLRLDAEEASGNVDLSPRIAFQYPVGDRATLSAAWGEYRQFPSPEALTYNADLTSASAVHYVLGLRHRFTDEVAGWIEGYVKDYRNLTLFDDSLRYTSDGVGTARGAEAFLRIDRDAFSGWISYALSFAERESPLRDAVYPFDFDQRHVLNLVASWKTGGGVSGFVPSLVSGTFRYASGAPYTPVTGAVLTDEGWRPIKGEINSERDPDYLNLNLRVEWEYRAGPLQITTFFEAWNVLNRKNVLGRTYRYGDSFPNNVLVQPHHATPLIVGGGFGIRL